jgi:hypothetical protein
MMHGSCHCGRVTVAMDEAEPEWVVSCNCSTCRKLPALWTYSTRDKVVIDGPTDTYGHGEHNLDIHRCKTCGATVGWIGTDPAYQRVGVNMRLFDGFERLRVRQLDGADTWDFLD